jgi:hypothetical protein
VSFVAARRKLLHIRVTEPFDDAIRRAVEQDETTVNEFARRALLAELRRRGLDPAKCRYQTESKRKS